MRKIILDTAAQAVLSDRNLSYGEPEDSFAQLAKVWSLRLGVEVSAPQAALMLIDLKLIRLWGNTAHQDSWVDVAGYAACGAETALGKSLVDKQDRPPYSQPTEKET